jgi:hypothetical protein
MGKARVPLTDDQSEALMDLYLKVPKSTQIHHEWQSPEGKALLELIYELMVANVPLRWIAAELNIDENMLQQTVNRLDYAVGTLRRRNRNDRR